MHIDPLGRSSWRSPTRRGVGTAGYEPLCTAAHLRVPRTRIERLVREETPVTPDTALRLARYLGTTADFWLRIPARYDLETLRRKLGKEINSITPRKIA